MDPNAHQATLMDWQRTSREWERHAYPFHLEHEMVAAGPVTVHSDWSWITVLRRWIDLCRSRAGGRPGPSPEPRPRQGAVR